MQVVELREPDAARRFVLQGLWLTRATPPAAQLVRPTLEWAFEIAASGSPLPTCWIRGGSRRRCVRA